MEFKSYSTPGYKKPHSWEMESMDCGSFVFAVFMSTTSLERHCEVEMNMRSAWASGMEFLPQKCIGEAIIIKRTAWSTNVETGLKIGTQIASCTAGTLKWFFEFPVCFES